MTKAQAEAAAIKFVKQNVKFYARSENSSIDLPAYNIDALKTYQENKNWVVVMSVSSKLNNETKKNDLVVKLNNNGDVIEFNGAKVPK